MSSAAVSVFNPTQVEGANFLNLLIVDDERAIREACREVAQSLGYTHPWPTRLSTPTACWTRKTLTRFSSS